MSGIERTSAPTVDNSRLELERDAASMRSLGGAEGAMAAALLILDSQQESSKKARQASRELRKARVDDQVQAMRDAAHDRLVASVVQGSTQIASGALSAGTAATNYSSSVDAAHAQQAQSRFQTTGDMQFADQAALLSESSAAAARTGELLGATGKVAGGALAMASGAAEESASNHDAEAASLSDEAQRAGDTARDHADDAARARDAQDRVLQRMESIAQARREAERLATRA